MSSNFIICSSSFHRFKGWPQKKKKKEKKTILCGFLSWYYDNPDLHRLKLTWQSSNTGWYIMKSLQTNSLPRFVTGFQAKAAAPKSQHPNTQEINYCEWRIHLANSESAQQQSVKHVFSRQTDTRHKWHLPFSVAQVCSLQQHQSKTTLRGTCYTYMHQNNIQLSKYSVSNPDCPICLWKWKTPAIHSSYVHFKRSFSCKADNHLLPLHGTFKRKTSLKCFQFPFSSSIHAGDQQLFSTCMQFCWPQNLLLCTVFDIHFWRLLWVHSPGHARVKGSDWADKTGRQSSRYKWLACWKIWSVELETLPASAKLRTPHHWSPGGGIERGSAYGFSHALRYHLELDRAVLLCL